MIERFVKWVASKLGQPRIIYGKKGTEPYLTRYYLFGRPRMPDGSWPFDSYGNMRHGAIMGSRLWGLNILLHNFHRGDEDPELHSHPWRWAFALVLVNGYSEERRVEGKDGYKVIRQDFWPFTLNLIFHDTFHRVDLHDGQEAWTIFVTGPKLGSWGFWNRITGVFTPWREFVEARQKGGTA